MLHFELFLLLSKEFNRNMTNQQLLSNLNNLNLHQMILQNNCNLTKNNSEDMIKNVKNQNLNLTNLSNWNN